MSIYFFHAMQAFFGVILLLALWSPKITLLESLLSLALGALGGISLYEISALYLLSPTLKIATDGMLLALLALFWPLIWLVNPWPKRLWIALLGVGFGVEYGVMSQDFPLLKGELLDTLSILSLGLLVLALLFLVLLLWLFSRIFASISPQAKRVCLWLVTLLLLGKILGEVGIALMRLGILPTHAWLLSLVAKLLHYAFWLPYIYGGIALILLGFYIQNRPPLRPKEELGSIFFRRLKAERERVGRFFGASVAILFLSAGFLLYYDLHASRPPKISTPEVLEPVNGEFRIAMERLRDNDLHRFAYVTDEGNKVRFFLLNRYPDRDAPVAVFDACMICGDMGYVKKGEELICIACNVRIFIPSVGKEGGCNPIPFPYEFDGKEVIIKLETILKGVHYFSEVVEKSVSDPVSGAKIINLKAPKTYIFGGKTYYFENEANYERFKENPEAFAGEATHAHWRAQGYKAMEETK